MKGPMLEKKAAADFSKRSQALRAANNNSTEIPKCIEAVFIPPMEKSLFVRSKGDISVNTKAFTLGNRH